MVCRSGGFGAAALGRVAAGAIGRIVPGRPANGGVRRAGTQGPPVGTARWAAERRHIWRAMADDEHYVYAVAL